MRSQPAHLARALMPHQPKSVAVPSTGGRLHPRFLREERLGEKGGAFLKGKEGFCPLEGEPKGS